METCEEGWQEGSHYGEEQWHRVCGHHLRTRPGVGEYRKPDAEHPALEHAVRRELRRHFETAFVCLEWTEYDRPGLPLTHSDHGWEVFIGTCRCDLRFCFYDTLLRALFHVLFWGSCLEAMHFRCDGCTITVGSASVLGGWSVFGYVSLITHLGGAFNYWVLFGVSGSEKSVRLVPAV